MQILLILPILALCIAGVIFYLYKPNKVDWSHLPTSHRLKPDNDPFARTQYR